MLIIDEQLRAVKGRGWQVKGKVLTEVLREASGSTWLSHMDVTARLSYPPGIRAAGASTGGVSGDSPWPAGPGTREQVSGDIRHIPACTTHSQHGSPLTCGAVEVIFF